MLKKEKRKKNSWEIQKKGGWLGFLCSFFSSRVVYLGHPVFFDLCVHI
jgi:hypothetical protein